MAVVRFAVVPGLALCMHCGHPIAGRHDVNGRCVRDIVIGRDVEGAARRLRLKTLQRLPLKMRAADREDA